MQDLTFLTEIPEREQKSFHKFIQSSEMADNNIEFRSLIKN